MSSIINVLSKLNIKENSSINFANNTTYPTNPSIGQLAFVNKMLVIYSDINGNATWVPLINSDVPTFTYIQFIENTSWLVTHGLNSDDLVYFVYDENDIVLYPSNVVFNSSNQFTLNFTESVKGKCIIFSGDLRINGDSLNSDINSTPNTIVLRDSSANVYANEFHGDGSNLTNLPSNNSDSLISYFDSLSTTNITYGANNEISEIVYISGNKKVINYESETDNITSVQYYDTDGTTLLGTQTFTYNVNGEFISIVWS